MIFLDMHMVRNDVLYVQNIWYLQEFIVLVVIQSYDQSQDGKNTKRLYMTYNYYWIKTLRLKKIPIKNIYSLFYWYVMISFLNLLILFMILCLGGIGVVVTGMIIDDITFWFIADMYFIIIFAITALVLYKATLFIKTLQKK